ncbi:hypothetical protein BO94DRAFT_583926 [Aspergillus sclerotioniger CBS 115572]|uniref:Uncharacterized protein n=1 Tax=Aspergillus sclerotioniger CBS 115572 TaxID=1450535 RepID=A0A317WXZ3_9EURO|nr:hypothetical protein BO94DRAFT_583926 [Aspergillus sclerotioniger CBS 115572]PWY91306.1 hypothetical protein BO94DRAFT_583926 [Aspergillus sclerotioniger CBS 115572]
MSNTIYITHTTTTSDTLSTILSTLLHDLTQVTEPTEITYSCIPPTMGSHLADALSENEIAESLNTKITYNSLTTTLHLRIFRPPLLAIQHSWINEQTFDWMDEQIMTRMEFKQLAFESNICFSAPYEFSRGTSDLQLRPRDKPLPSFVIESTWAETYERVRENEGNDEVEGVVEVWVRDEVNVWETVVRQREVIFPADEAVADRLKVTWGEVFGGHLPDGRDKGEYLYLELESLQFQARNALERMGLRAAGDE